MHIRHRDEHGNPIYTNHLIDSASPYLVQHAHNPVDWHEWGDAALTKAQSLDKPILISIGYAACHWCHVMAHESFEDEPTAALQNELFINIKVDREERPDIDSVYMSAVQAMTGQGGWPLNVFCTPDGTPFYGGTYFPPDAKAARYRMPSWKQVLRSVAEAYRTRRADVAATGQQLLEHLGKLSAASAPAAAAPLPSDLVHTAVDTLEPGFDPVEGGFGGAPKFPQPMTLELLLRAHLRGHADALPMLELTLRKMARGGMYDQLGGGFHRYSVDAHWLVPHFEKMLYDNALLARLYAEAYQVTQLPLYRTIAEETLAYLSREMLHPEGGFYSTQDADSLPHPQAEHAEEGAFFVWTPDEVRELLGADAALFCQIFDVTKSGNFEGSNILNLPREVAEVARVTGATAERIEQVFAAGRAKLLAARARRPKPFRDEKIIAAWNGMALRALAVAASAFENQQYIAVAQGCADFILTHLRRPDGRLLRSWKDGRPGPLGFLEDYALVADGLLALHAADGDPRWLRECLALADAMVELFWDESLGGFYDTAADHEALITRPRDVGDNATPSGNSVAAELLLRLAALTGDDAYRERAERVLAGAAPLMARFPAGFGRMLCAADLLTSSVTELAIVGDPQAADTAALVDVALRPYRPHIVIARLSPGDGETPALTPLLQGREAVGGRATAYVCQGFVCRLPASTTEELAAQLAE
ncbi:thioredoxin domain-containing protein [Oscillochloris sp. ZM17-4]|uniref:thioredoxin domain-containing protein n=1 Tax=Oscillochloris sp. ZM17-4 TaxID=2866714 RepID=UPI001C734621|nr:thioredoxin domain-containing protein [Oscillochloris sp. ZM17-4]MBX0329791.1 thioredoxin domain-containing protein [Oscillochloris sp. ZM17-4]